MSPRERLSLFRKTRRFHRVFHVRYGTVLLGCPNLFCRQQVQRLRATGPGGVSRG